MIHQKLPTSVIVLTQNEEPHIESCLRSIVGWAGETFVVDSGSTDRTLEIAGRFTNKITYHAFDNYSRQRNWAQANLPLNYNWVFHIDADERVSPELVARLAEFFKKMPPDQQIVGLLVRRRIEFLGKHISHGGIYPTYHCRVFRKDRGRCEDREYDQHFLVDGPTLKIEADLVEITASSLFSWTSRHNRWAQMEAHHLLQSVDNSSLNLIHAKVTGSPIERRRWFRTYYERSPLFLRAFIYFCGRYFLKCGFLDGIPGLIYHVLHGFWFRFYVDALYYETKHNKGEIHPELPCQTSISQTVNTE